MYGAYAWIIPAPENPTVNKPTKIEITAGDVRWLAENWTTQWQRPPSRDELRGLITDYLNEQLFAREARALGLENNDVIIRRRLAQKLTFIIDDTIRRAEPTEQELQQYYEANARRFRSDARISFAHIYFSPQRRADARSDAADALQLLLAEDATTWAVDLGDRLLIGSELRDETEQSVSNTFGPAFARAVFALGTGSWSGPVQSGYGLHLVRISRQKVARMAPLSEIRERVAAEWKREQETRAKNRYLAELRKKYDVVADEEVKALIAPQRRPPGSKKSRAKRGRPGTVTPPFPRRFSTNAWGQPLRRRYSPFDALVPIGLLNRLHGTILPPTLTDVSYSRSRSSDICSIAEYVS